MIIFWYLYIPGAGILGGLGEGLVSLGSGGPGEDCSGTEVSTNGAGSVNKSSEDAYKQIHTAVKVP